MASNGNVPVRIYSINNHNLNYTSGKTISKGSGKTGSASKKLNLLTREKKTSQGGLVDTDEFINSRVMLGTPAQ